MVDRLATSLGSHPPEGPLRSSCVQFLLRPKTLTLLLSQALLNLSDWLRTIASLNIFSAFHCLGAILNSIGLALAYRQRFSARILPFTSDCDSVLGTAQF